MTDAEINKEVLEAAREMIEACDTLAYGRGNTARDRAIRALKRAVAKAEEKNYVSGCETCNDEIDESSDAVTGAGDK